MDALSMEVIGASRQRRATLCEGETFGVTDVGVGDGRLLRDAGAGLALQPILQNGLER